MRRALILASSALALWGAGSATAQDRGTALPTGQALTPLAAPGARFAPLVALLLASNFGLWSVGAYLLSGAACTLAALAINRDWARPGE